MKKLEDYTLSELETLAQAEALINKDNTTYPEPDQEMIKYMAKRALEMVGIWSKDKDIAKYLSYSNSGMACGCMGPSVETDPYCTCQFSDYLCRNKYAILKYLKET